MVKSEEKEVKETVKADSGEQTKASGDVVEQDSDSGSMIDDLRNQIVEMRKQFDDSKGQFEQLQKQYEQEKADWTLLKAIHVQVGLTDEDAIDVAKTLHKKHGNGVELVEWLMAQKENPHPSLSSFFGSRPAHTPTQPPPKSKIVPAPNASSELSGSASQAYQRELWKEAEKTGNWGKWDAYMESLRKK